MQHAPSLEFLQRELRSKVCRHCCLRPPGSRARALDVPRPCEARCAVFATLPSVRRIGEYLDPMVESYEKALSHLYRDVCEQGAPVAAATARGATPCDRRALRRYQRRVIEVLAAALNRNA
jgi:hypothetical protein